MTAATEKSAQKIIIRSANSSDLADINSIFNHYVVSSTAAFAVTENAEAQRRQWFGRHLEAPLPVLVMD